MCLIVFASGAHSRYELIFAANRDEFHKRESKAAQFWPESTQLLAGRDLERGGTWCGITQQGRIAAVTNFRDPSTVDPSRKSRGLLVRDYLLDTNPAETSAQAIEASKNAYSEFNLLIGDRDGLYCVGSRSNGPQPIAPGLHAISNGPIDSQWPKMKRARADLETLIGSHDVSTERLFGLLSSRERAQDKELPDTGIERELESFLSPVFIQGEAYGTRCSTVILVDVDGQVKFCERRFNSAGECVGETDELFKIAA